MKTRAFRELRDHVAALSTPDHPVEVFGTWRVTLAEQAVGVEAQTLEIEKEDLDAFFSNLEGSPRQRAACRSLLTKNLKHVSAFRVARGAETERFVVGRSRQFDAWIGMKQRLIKAPHGRGAP